MVLVSKENKRRVYEYLLKEGVIVVKKDAYLPKHQHLTEVPNLQVMMVVKSLRSKGFLSEVFNWGWSYNFITNKGVAFLVKELGKKLLSILGANFWFSILGLPADIVPATFKKRRATTAAPKVKGEEGDEKPMRPEEETSGRAPYGRGSRW